MLGFMATDFFAKSPVLIYPLVALFSFMGAFVIVSARLFFSKSDDLAKRAQLPLEADDE